MPKSAQAEKFDRSSRCELLRCDHRQILLPVVPIDCGVCLKRSVEGLSTADREIGKVSQSPIWPDCFGLSRELRLRSAG